MLSFVAYDNGVLIEQWDLHHAHLIGADDIGMQGEIRIEAGRIECEKRSIEPAALALMVEVEGLGRLILQTCLLPGREKPYLLFLEIARCQIKIFLVKLEDWSILELNTNLSVVAKWEQARALFTEAVIMELDDPSRADELAREALRCAMVASEQLAVMYADILLAKRFAERQMPQRALGCCVHQSMFAEPLTKILEQDFDFISIPLRWHEIEPEEGEYDWSQLDRWMEWATSKDYVVFAGPLIDFRSLSVPEWLYIWEHDYDTTHDLLHEHIEAIVERYKGAVTVWNVASSLHINENFTLPYDQMMDLTRMATSLVKSLHPEGKTLIEFTEPFGEYYAANPKSVPPIVYAETIAQSGFQLDHIGVNLQFGHHRMGRGTRDLMQISALLDKLRFLELPVIITGLGVPSQRPKLDGADPAGFWHVPWSPQHQAEWLHKVIAIALSKPFVESVCVQELYDHATSELPGAGLITVNGRAKPALTRIAGIHAEIRRDRFRCSQPDERDWSISDLAASAEDMV